MRKLLATTLTLEGGVLTINGTNEADRVVLFQNGDGTFDLEDSGTTTNYSNAEVDKIVFRGRLGDDEFVNNTFEASEFFGHGGNDIFFGGVGDDLAFGGGDDDELHGGLGNDRLNGSDGNDTIFGEQGDDTVFGGQGDDRIFGGEGDDFLSAEQGDDEIHGGEGDDFLRGFNGNDLIFGDEGNDLAFGQGGEDEIHGGDGNDRLRGNNDDDLIFGNLGDDVLIGDVGDDEFHGDDGNDLIFGWIGNDILNGGNGDDRLFDGEGDDQLDGGAGQDVLRGGVGNDFLQGGDGFDVLRGEAGNDTLYGGHQLDRLFGGAGDDSLHGGAGEDIDHVEGNEGSDRFHQDDNDDIVDRVDQDVTVRYETTSSTWTNLEIEVLDRGFQRFYDQAGSNELLRETHSVGDYVTIHKFVDLPGTITSRNVINEVTGEREIHIVDFDETTNIGQSFFEGEIIRQFGFNWDSAEELASANENLAAQWQEFLALSGWTQTNPQSSDFVQSGDGQWWHLVSANFSSTQGRENPQEDFVGVWNSLMTEAFSNGLVPKINWLSSAIQSI